MRAIGILTKFPVRVLTVCLLTATLLHYINSSIHEASGSLIFISIINYFVSLFFLGVGGTCVIHLFIRKGFTASDTNALIRLSRSFPIASALLIAGVYAVVSTLGGVVESNFGLSPWMQFAATFLTKAIGAVCMAFIALCLLQLRKQH